MPVFFLSFGLGTGIGSGFIYPTIMGYMANLFPDKRGSVSGIIAGVYGKTVYVADGGPDGAAAMLVNHDSRLTRVIKVEGGQPVTVEYMAKAVETPAN